MQEKTVLFVTRELPLWGDNGGSAYAYAVLRELARSGISIHWAVVGDEYSNGRLMFAFRVPDWLTGLQLQSHRLLCGYLICRSPLLWLRQKYWRLRSFLRKLECPPAKQQGGRGGGGEHLCEISDFSNESEREWVSSMLLSGPWQHVIVDRVYLLDGIPETVSAARSFQLLLLTVDAYWRRTEMVALWSKGSAQMGLSRNGESARFQRCDAIIAIQPEEANLFQEMAPDAEVLTVPMPMSFRAGLPPAGGGACGLIVAGPAPHNSRSIRWFLAEVWPSIHEQCPDATLVIAGGICKTIAWVPDGVSLAGFVTDLTPLYVQATVCIVPLLFGTGLKLKLVEAMAHGRMVISTSAGIQGYPELRDTVVPVCDDTGGLTDLLIRSLREPIWRVDMQERQAAWMKQHFLPEIAVAPLVEYLRRCHDAG